MASKRADKAISSKFSIIDDNEQDLFKAASALERDVARAVREFYAKMRVDIAGLDPTESASTIAKEVNKFERDLLESIQKDRAYKSSLNSYLKTFDDLDNLNARIHKGLSKIEIKDVLKSVEPEKLDRIKQLSDDLIGQGVSTNFTKPIRRSLYSNLLLGSSIKDANKIFDDFITGDEERLGQLRRYSSQVARDSLHQYDGMLNDAVREEFDLNAFRYVGTLVDDSRPQCKRWLTHANFNGIIKVEVLNEELSRSENTGQIPNTTAKNFGQLRGGYNCRHQAIPFLLLEEKEVNDKGAESQSSDEALEVG